MKRLIYLKNGQSLDLLVSPLKLIMSLMVSKQRKERNIKMIGQYNVILPISTSQVFCGNGPSNNSTTAG
jgi:hypothetical protein